MARPTLTVVGGKPDTDSDAVKAEVIAAACQRMEAAAQDPDGMFWLVTVVKNDVTVAYLGGEMETSALAEVIAAESKREAMGL